MTSQRTRLRLVTLLRKEGIKNEEVLKAIEKVPRHLFVDNAISHRAYENIPLPIGENQTISQPYTVARMTELLLEGMKKNTKKRDANIRNRLRLRLSDCSLVTTLRECFRHRTYLQSLQESSAQS